MNAAVHRPGRAGASGRYRLADLAALVAGGVLPLAFAPFGWWWFAVLGPAVLFHLWMACPPRRAAWLGWLFGVGMWGGGVYWIYHSLHHFGSAVAPLAAVLTVAFALAMALTLAVLGWLAAIGRPDRRGALWLILPVPAAWVALEWVRSWLLTGFPWLLLGSSQIDAPLAGYAPVIGVYGVGLLVAVTAGVVAAVPRLRGHTRVIPLAAIAGLWLGGFMLDGRDWSRPDGEALRVGLVQGNVAQEEKFDSVRRSVDLYKDRTRAIAPEVDLVVWPETAVPTFWYHVAEELSGFAAGLDGTDVMTGVFTFDTESGRYYNSVLTLGSEPDVYSKQRLVPFGEYMPLREWLGFLDAVITIPMSDLAPPPAGQGTLQAAGTRIAAFVCYEAAYPAVVRHLARDAGVLVNVSNDAWFGDSTAPGQHLEIARMRALETGRPMLRATNTGISAFIDHHGRVLARGPQFEVATLVGEIRPRTGMTPYVRLGDGPVLGLLVAVLAAWGVAGRRGMVRVRG